MAKAALPTTGQIQTDPYDTGRIDLTDRGHFLKVNNLIDHHIDSFRWFVEEGVAELFKELGPIEEDVTYTRTTDSGASKQDRVRLKLDFGRLEFTTPAISDLKARYDNLTYEALLKAEVRLTKGDGRRQRQTVYMGYYPWMTDRATFIINGTERIIVSQISRSPGVVFNVTSLGDTGRPLYGAKIAPYRGTWLELTTLKDGDMSIKIDKSRRLSLSSFLIALGWKPAEIKRHLAAVNNNPEIDFWEKTLAKDSNFNDDYDRYYNDALRDVYRRLRPGDSVNTKNAKEVLEGRFFNPRYYDLAPPGRHKINQRLGLAETDSRTLTRDDILAVVKEMVRLNNSGDPADDIDSLDNRRIKMVGELVRNQFRIGLARMERNIRERMRQCELATVTPSQLINARPITASINTFFSASQLSLYMDQVNPLSEIADKRRLTAGGPGGLNRERAGPSARDLHQTHYGRICPVESPEGGQIGLVLSMAIYAQVDEYGFLRTPYRLVVRQVAANDLAGEVARQDLVDKAGRLLTKADAKISPEAVQKLLDSGIKGTDLYPVKPRVSDQFVYMAAAEEAEACILGARVQFDKDGYFIDDYGPGWRRRIAGQYSVSEATHVDASQRQIVGVSAALVPFIEKDYSARALTAANQARQALPLVIPKAPIVGSGIEEVIARNTGQVIYAAAAGKVVSATAAKLIVKYDRQPTTQVYEPLIYMRSNKDTAISQRVVVKTGDRVKAGQPMVEGASIENGELALGRDLLVALMFWEGNNFEDAVVISERLIKDDTLTSINITEHTVDVRETKLGPEMVTRDIPNVSEYSLRNLDEGGIVRVGAEVNARDILVGKITPKGEQELSSEERLLRAIFGEKAKDVRDTSLKLPNGKSGKVIEVRIFNKDAGDDIKKTDVLQQIQIYVAQSRKVEVGDKLTGRHGNKGVIARILPEEDMPFTEDGRPVDLVLNPIGVPARMNLGQLFESHLGLAAAGLGLKVNSPPLDGVSNEKIVEMLEKAGLAPDGKQQLYDGRTGKPFVERSTVGYMYFYKLNHMVSDKVHARSTGPVVIVTQQPIGGKSLNGGQRFGEMEVWALEAYGAATTLQEILTLKSDDVTGRAKAYEAMIKQTDIVSSKVPESFNVLIKELQGLGLKVDLIDSRSETVVDAEDMIKVETEKVGSSQTPPPTSAPTPPESLPASRPDSVESAPEAPATPAPKTNLKVRVETTDGS